ncbi:MAG: phosphomannomutase [Candidatus Woesebacteria bacterium GW2011_GWA1_39_8]|uniref:Phosphomannomutase n=1 Tax=Candidatus Woesebacteria bacterium GW2011_GWA1_39_8 TaxID=1618552 RepID=A0A0G0PRQ9_9BACT|nr:MAG: phosphomannomutase [Candidatus Woesebacteria bacterium GW2011_GWA1_39_8]
MESANLLEKVKNGFRLLKIDEIYKNSAITFLKDWITREEFSDYKPQILHLIESKDWDYLLDCFYQIIPFGTGGRRGEVGIGPNRINTWTIKSSAQGHSQYLTKIYKSEVKTRGIVLAYGVREFFTNKHLDEELPNPVRNLTGKDLAYAAAEVYTANNIKTYIFDAPRTTPELSFSIRYLNAIAGDMFDASHNPPEHNGKKVYDEHGGQLIPPDDELLVKEVTQSVKTINNINIEEAKKTSKLVLIGSDVDKAYIKETSNLTLSKDRELDIIYTPLHGVGSTSVLKTLEHVGFKVSPDPKTSNQSGKFENITFNIPNPEVIESFDTTLEYAKDKKADIILNSDPDADRIGIMVKHNGKWSYINGNEIGVILTRYVIEKKKEDLAGVGIVIKTSVTTNLSKIIAEKNNMLTNGELPVGFKYIGAEMNNLERSGKIDNLLLGLEESHGYIAGNYLRDKDACVGAIWLAELGASLKKMNLTLIDYLDETYSKYGYFRNYLTEIRLPGAQGMAEIHKIQDSLRTENPTSFGEYKVDHIEDYWNRKPIVSETDKVSKDVLVFHFKTFSNFISVKVTLRPSGTEPKIKMYFELGSAPVEPNMLVYYKLEIEDELLKLERTFMKHCYKVIGVDFPNRGFLLFWQLPMADKLKYFEIEPNIESLRNLKSKDERIEKLTSLLEFLGSDPIQKVDKAFKAKNKVGIKQFLDI